MKRLILLLSVMAFLFSGCDFFENKKLFSNDVDTLQQYLQKKDSIRKVDSLLQIKKRAQKMKLAEKAKKDSIKRAEERQRSLYKYHVVVGSFKTHNYATAYKDFIAQKGYKTEMLRNKYKFDMISVGAYKSWRKAVNDLNKTRGNLEATAWIYIDE
ncbi:MAG: hypothetical protein PF487_10875 [Bacteroidales bacterium]|jgi:cell division protein FtsN|nr:hypothetical protein [Bacteroidales bacterium]